MVVVYDIFDKQYVSAGKIAIHVWLAAKLTTPPHPKAVTEQQLKRHFFIVENFASYNVSRRRKSQ